jgi:hypothetical protein
MVAVARGVKGKPHPQWFQDVLNEGHRAEPEILARNLAEQTGFPRYVEPSSGKDQHEVYLDVGEIDGKRVVIVGHVDAIQADEWGDWQYVVEAKKFRKSTYKTAASKGPWYTDYYLTQMSIYMHATGLKGKWVAGEWDGERIIDHRTHELQVPPVSLPFIKMRVARVERLLNEGYMPDEVECTNNYPCPFWFLHDVKEKGSSKVSADKKVLEGEAEALAFQLAEVQELISSEKEILKALEDQKKELAAQFKKLTSDDPADTKWSVANGDLEVDITRVQSDVPEKVTKAYKLDYYKINVKRS